MHDKKIKLFVDAHCFDAEYQGTRTFVKEIYQILSHKKDLILYLAAYDTEVLSATFPKAENIVILKYWNRSSIVRLAIDIPILIKRHQIDIAHFQYITPLIKNCKQVVTIHDVLFRDYPSEFSFPFQITKRFLYKRAAKQADIVTTVSAFSKASIEKHLSPKDNVYVVSNGVSPQFFEPYSKQEAKAFILNKFGFDKFVLYVSRIEPRKNHLTILHAFEQLKLHQKGYHLVFLGHETKQVPSLKKALRAAESSLQKKVFINGQVRDPDLLQFYRAAEVFIYPSKAEGFGIPPLEAAAVNIPVICSNTSAMEAFSFFGDTHINPLDLDVLKKKLMELTTCQPPSASLSAIAEMIKTNYSWQGSAEKMYHLIKTIAHDQL